MAIRRVAEARAAAGAGCILATADAFFQIAQANRVRRLLLTLLKSTPEPHVAYLHQLLCLQVSLLSHFPATPAMVEDHALRMLFDLLAADSMQTILCVAELCKLVLRCCGLHHGTTLCGHLFVIMTQSPMLHSENTAPTSQEVAAFRRASLIACHSVGLLDCVLPLSLFHQSPRAAEIVRDASIAQELMATLLLMNPPPLVRPFLFDCHIFFHDFAALIGLPHPVENHSVEEEVPCPA